MSEKEMVNTPEYAHRACLVFQEIMSSSHRSMLEKMNRANKGELFVLQFLAMSHTAVLPSELSAALGASTARISALLGALEKKGQIVRNIDRSNRRNILVTLTPAGRSRAEIKMRQMQEGMTSVFTEMGEADTAEFLRLSEKFSVLMQKHMEN